ncbi:bifunctional diguanylate cyclase/phosphodiesterase [Nitrosomonas sp. Nm166]|uniref:sensor domain-containing protein n=1 Tax=Nitrosomonas sp. Nm166 TaxID=1881054 RepID=UPI0008F41544|nr:bifunctional diguanylate cyclase/phosphodiesterase [Nitrosomonas sp. Nm166]SFE23456.1 PAS domain S-box-containing protein/diguanylate cyclase (GGDEF) domain-containing protein [Nitrosomonas sp. Nm166]
MSNDHIVSEEFPKINAPIHVSTILSEGQLSELFDEIKDLIQSVALNGHFLFANRAWRETLGYSVEEVATLNIFNIIHPDHHLHYQKFLQRMITGDGESVGLIEIPFLSKDRQIIVLEGNVNLYSIDNLPIAIRGIFRNISKRKAVEAEISALKEKPVDITSQNRMEMAPCNNEQLFRGLTEVAPVGIFRTDATGKCLYVNERWCNIAGMDAKTASGYGWIAAIHPDDCARVMNEWDKAVQYHRQFLSEYRFQTKEQIITWILGHAQAERDQNGELAGYVGTITDITDQKMKEAALAESRNLLETIIDTAPVRIFWKDRSLRFLGCNSMFARDAGAKSVQDVIGSDDYQWSWRAQAESYRNDDQVVINSGIPKLAYEEPQTTPDGRMIWLRTSKVPLRNGHQEIIGVLGIYQDITKQKRIYESMRLAATIYQSSNEAIMVTDENDLIIHINPAFTRMTGYEKADVVGKSPEIFRSGRHDAVFYQDIRRRLLNEDYWQGEIWDLRKDGTAHAKWLNMSVIRHPDGRIHYHVSQFTDITEKKKKDELILSQANYDQLTGLPNRNLFKDRLERKIKQSRRIGQPLSLLFLDLDHFKDINDTLGHDKGDDLLREVAARIKSCITGTDTVARLGGDEFAVILSDSVSNQRVEPIASHIIQNLNKPFNFNQNRTNYHISTSIGIAFYPQDGADMKSLMKHADQAMYAAKLEGRNRFCYFTPSMQREAYEKMALIHDLREARGRNELQVYYQPILELSSGRLIKAEALVRWKHSRRGMISPTVFIPLAEESGLILEIGEMVFKQSIALIDQWQKRLGYMIQISVNMSPVQFKFMNKFSWLDELTQLGLPGSCINVEITEGLLLKDSAIVQEYLLEFRNSGIEVSIDDFGTGFSSLSYLKKFDIDYLKIDHSFISQLIDSETDRTLVEAIIVMAHKLGIKTIAEGVETKEQLDLLTQFDCDYVQGFFYSEPIKGKAFEKLLFEQLNRTKQ